MHIVELSGVSKVYDRHGGRILLRNRINEWVSGRPHETYTALKNISFSLKRGESMAVVGQNGAGKSTLLSLLAGLSKPSTGSVFVKGRIAALLELGSGFHPDLTPGHIA